MRIDIRAHYWPATPDLREIKLVVDDKVILSEFLNSSQVMDLAKQFSGIEADLVSVAVGIDNKGI